MAKQNVKSVRLDLRYVRRRQVPTLPSVSRQGWSALCLIERRRGVLRPPRLPNRCAAGKSSYFPGSYDCQLLKPHPPTLSNTMARSTMTIFLNIFLGASQPAKRRCGLLAAGLSRFALTKVCGRRGQKTCPRRLRSFGGFPRPILAALAAPRLAPLLWWLAPLFGRLAPPFRRFGVVLWPAPSEFCHNATKRLF